MTVSAPQLLIINGTSSTGKTTLARTLQDRWPSPLIYLGLDSWITMTLARRYWDSATQLADIKSDDWVRQGTHFVMPHSPTNDSPWIKINSGPISDQLVFAMHDTALHLMQQGFDVVLDCVLLKAAWRDDLLQKSAHHQRCLIHMTAPEAVLIERERARGDRMRDVFRHLAATIHIGLQYNVSIDSSQQSPTQAAEQVFQWLNSPSNEGNTRLMHAL